MLILHRKEGEVVFGGHDLDPAYPEPTASRAVIVRELDATSKEHSVLVEIVSPDGAITAKRLARGDMHEIEAGVLLCFSGVGKFKPELDGRPHAYARLGFVAPRSYRLVRDNAARMAA